MSVQVIDLNTHAMSITELVANASAESSISVKPATKFPRKSSVISKAPRTKPMTKDVRILGQPGFVLHSYPYKETSLIIDVFTRDYGRLALVAKGAKRPYSQLRNILQTFQPLTMSWSGKSDIKTLSTAEWVGGMLPLEKSALLCGFYLNELLVKFLMRDEPCPSLFDHYVSTLNQLAHQEPALIVLRKFEHALLRESGFVGDLTRCYMTKSTVLNQELYIIDPELGARPARPSDTTPRVKGKTLIDMHAGEYQDPITQSQSKMLMRFLLAHHLHGTPLNTRQILIDLQNL